MEEIMKQRNRKLKEDAKRECIKIRIDSNDRQMLDYMQALTGKSVSEILRYGVEMQYEYEKRLKNKS